MSVLRGLGVLLVAVLAVACGNTSAGPLSPRVGATTVSPPSSESTPSVGQPSDRRLFPPCNPGAFRHPQLHWVSPATGEHAFTVALTLGGSRPCSVRGYPRVRLFDRAGNVIPFVFVRGKGQYVSSRPPAWVNRRPGQRIFTEIAKYRCDTSNFQPISTGTITVGLSRVRLQVPHRLVFTYCGRGDPGSVVQLARLASRKTDVFPG